MGALTLRGWRPIRIYWNGSEVMVDWARLGDAPHLQPFFQDSVSQQLRKPFHNAFRRQTSLGEMIAWHEQSPGLTPCAVVFHVSRCGSTLISQALSQSAHHLALSEPVPLDVLLRQALVDGWLTEDEVIAATRAWLSAWAQRSDAGSPPLESVSIKLDAWNTHQAPLIAKAWPNAQQIFLTRDPLAVLVSQMQERAFYMVPGAMGAHFGPAGFSVLEQAIMPSAEYCARILGRIYADMARVAHPENALILDHAELPAAIEQQLLERLDWEPNDHELQAMRERLSRHGKRPTESFVSDASAKHASAKEEWRTLVAKWIEPHYRALLQQRADYMKNMTEAVT
ncbi:sulfotransferase [Diaphorobacter sp. HDW4B]|uniref:sulfotransferase n=1 Tax=Diaphorobacter sp. HDW4B TaxID=2714925 RepID=UPI00140AE739|nr:sulfotransferase [Diaphorobacter sp. HDW4B]QIL72980.1 sulfotransferase [Diaphorobacter sp. HDW4B]